MQSRIEQFKQGTVGATSARRAPSPATVRRAPIAAAAWSPTAKARLELAAEVAKLRAENEALLRLRRRGRKAGGR